MSRLPIGNIHRELIGFSPLKPYRQVLTAAATVARTNRSLTSARHFSFTFSFYPFYFSFLNSQLSNLKFLQLPAFLARMVGLCPTRCLLSPDSIGIPTSIFFPPSSPLSTPPTPPSPPHLPILHASFLGPGFYQKFDYLGMTHLFRYAQGRIILPLYTHGGINIGLRRQQQSDDLGMTLH